MTNANSSRRRVLGMSVGLGAAAAGLSPWRARAQEKIAQAMVQYQANPKNGQVCSGCANWQPPNACAIVVGNIAPQGWCVAFAPKAPQ